MDNLIYVLAICICAPLLLMMIIADNKTRRLLGFMIIGIGISIVAAEFNSIMRDMVFTSLDLFHLTTSVTPISEEVLKALPILFVAIFSAACIVDYKKNQHTSEIAYNGKTIDIVHISTLNFKAEPLSNGTLICVDLQELQPYLDNDEAYFIWRMPHKSLNAIFKPYVDVGNVMERLRDLITTPVVSEKYGYSVRINESRLLPEEITRIGMFHRQKLKKATITISIDENYELNDAGCYRIRRLEEKLYRHYLPEDYRCEDIITYQWNQNREDSLQGQFNFYYSITKNSISRASMLLYMILLLAVGVFGDFISEAVQALIRLFI